MTFFEDTPQRMKTRVMVVIRGQTGLVLDRVNGGVQ